MHLTGIIFKVTQKHIQPKLFSSEYKKGEKELKDKFKRTEMNYIIKKQQENSNSKNQSILVKAVHLKKAVKIYFHII